GGAGGGGPGRPRPGWAGGVPSPRRSGGGGSGSSGGGPQTGCRVRGAHGVPYRPVRRGKQAGGGERTTSPPPGRINRWSTADQREGVEGITMNAVATFSPPFSS